MPLRDPFADLIAPREADPFGDLIAASAPPAPSRPASTPSQSRYESLLQLDVPRARTSDLPLAGRGSMPADRTVEEQRIIEDAPVYNPPVVPRPSVPDPASRHDPFVSPETVAEYERAKAMHARQGYPLNNDPESSFLNDMRLALVQGGVGIAKGAVGLADMASQAGEVIAGNIAAGRIPTDPAGALLPSAVRVPQLGQQLSDAGIRFDDIQAGLESGKTDALRGQSQAFQEADGIMRKAGIAATSPRLIVDAALQSLPGMVASGAVASRLLGSTPLAAAVGEGGFMAGTDATAMREESPDGRLSKEQMALSAAIGFIGGAIGRASNALAKTLGTTDVDGLLVGIARNPASRQSFARNIALNYVQEGSEEVAQGIFETALTNLGTGKPLTDGMAADALLGFAVGGAMGAGAEVAQIPAGLVERREARQAQAADDARRAENTAAFNAANEVYNQRFTPEGRATALEQWRQEQQAQAAPPASPENVRAAFDRMRAGRSAATTTEEQANIPVETAPIGQDIGQPIGQEPEVSDSAAPWSNDGINESSLLKTHQANYSPMASFDDLIAPVEASQTASTSAQVSTDSTQQFVKAAKVSVELDGTGALVVRFVKQPSYGTLESLKSRGFRWSKEDKAWYHRNPERLTTERGDDALRFAIQKTRALVGLPIDEDLRKPDFDYNEERKRRASTPSTQAAGASMEPDSFDMAPRERVSDDEARAALTDEDRVSDAPAGAGRDWPLILGHARAQGYTGSAEALLRAKQDIEGFEAAGREETDSTDTGVELLKAIRDAGGIKDDGGGEFATLWEASTGFVPQGKTKAGDRYKKSRNYATGGLLGVGNVLRKYGEGGRSWDYIREALSQEPAFRRFADMSATDLMNEVMELVGTRTAQGKGREGRARGVDYTRPGWWQDRVNDAGYTPVEQEASDYLGTFTAEARRELYEALRDDEDQADAIGVQAEIFKRLEQEYANGDVAGTDQPTAAVAGSRADDRTAEQSPRRAGQGAAQVNRANPQGDVALPGFERVRSQALGAVDPKIARVSAQAPDDGFALSAERADGRTLSTREQLEDAGQRSIFDAPREGVARPLSTNTLAEDFGQREPAEATMQIAEAIGLPTERIKTAKGGEPGAGSLEQTRRKTRAVDTSSEAFRRWFGLSKVVGEDGKPLVVYHGSKRSDRIGNQFRKSRATSGPSAYFTVNPEIASSYATGKEDTSLEQPDNYSEWFNFKPAGARSTVSIDRAWWYLTSEQKQAIEQRLPHVVNVDENGDELPSGQYRLGGEDEYGLAGKDHWDYILRREARGNPLAAAVEIWLNSGSLFNSESEFMDVLRLGGMPMEQVTFNDPWASRSGVFPVYLSIKNPLDTRNVPQHVVDALEKRSRRQRAPRTEYGADMWDKNLRDPREWMQMLRDDIAKGANSSVWTSIPDWVSETLADLGYDGIHDQGGKMGGESHDVWIPFEPTQIKSALANRGTFDLDSANLLYQSAYHGSPHIFDKFSLHAIGSGEGAQAYGWGLYFAGKREIAEYYRDTLSKRELVDKHGEPMVYQGSAFGVEATALDILRNQYRAHDPFASALSLIGDENQRARDLSDVIRRWRDDGVKFSSSGRLYKVEIPEDEDFLLWDKPLSEQSEKVKRAIASLGVVITPQRWVAHQITDSDINARLYPGAKVGRWVSRTESPTGQSDAWGGQVYNTRESAEENAAQRQKWQSSETKGKDIYYAASSSPRRSSEILASAGVAGIKYLDGTSRSKGDGTYNYVVFDDNLVQIMEFEQRQRSGGIRRASVEFSGGLKALRQGTETALIRALDAPNASSGVHEIAHIARRWLLNRDVPQEQRVGITDQDIAITETWAGVSDGKWTTAAEEKFARGFERYLRDGVSPTPRLSKVFKAFATWLRDIYQSVIGSEIDVEISPEMRTVYDRLVTRAERIASGEAAREMQAAPSRSAQMVHGSTYRLSTLQPGSMFSDDPVWAAGYTTKLDAIGDGESFVGSVHHFDVPAGPTLTARSVHAAEGLVIDRATDILGRQPASLKEAAEAVAKETGAVAVLAERDGKVTGGILLVSAPVTGHADPREALRRARERGKDIPDNLSKALARKSGPPSTVKAKPSPVPDDIRTLGADDDSTPEFGASLEVPEAVRASLATSEQAALDRLRKKQAGGGVLYQDARPKRLSRFALDKPIKGQGGNSLVGYEWRWTYGERERADGDVVAAKVSDWDNFATSEGTGRKIVHVFYVQHADGRVTEEGINSAQSLLGIQNTRLRTIAEKEAARQKVFRKNVVDEVNDREANAFDSIGEAARNWWSRNRVATEADFKQTYGLTKDGKHIRYMGFAESIEGNKGSVKPLWPAMLDEFKARGWTVEAIGSTPADTSVLYQADLPTNAVDTSSESFKRWFGQSKVVDKSGKPLRVYHGTPEKGIESFREGMAFFTSNQALADGYTAKRGLWLSSRDGEVVQAYLALENPLVIDALGKRSDNIPVPWQAWSAKVFGTLPKNAVSVRAAAEKAQALGHDGLIVRNVIDTPSSDGTTRSDVYVAFSPTQIKSATSNRGTFDPTNPSILYQSDAAEALPDDLPFDDRNDLLIVGAAKMARGVTDFQKWSEAMRADLGDTIAPSLRDLYTASRNRAVLLSKFDPDDYFNFKRSSLTGDTLEALRSSVIDTVLATGRIPKERETWDEIKVDAEYYGPEIVKHLAPFQKQQAQFRVVRYAAKQRIDVLKAEIYADWQRIDRLRLKGELDPTAYAVEERKIAAKERDVRGLLDVWMRMRSEDGRNLAMHRIIAERTWDDYEFWTKRAKRAMGLPPGVDLPREVEKRINEIIQGGKQRIAERKARAPREAAPKPSGPPSSKPRVRTFTPKTDGQAKRLALVEQMKAAMAAKAQAIAGNVLYQIDRATKAVDTSSEAFKRWFGKSKVVDDSGKPLRVYHGTDKRFSRFDSALALKGNVHSLTYGVPMFFSTNSKRTARTYGRRVMPLYVSLQNPLVVDARGNDFTYAFSLVQDELPVSRNASARAFTEYRDSLIDKYGDDAWERADDLRAITTPEEYERLKSLQQAAEDDRSYSPSVRQYDGIIIKNVIDTADGSTDFATVYAAFRPEQIKSATSNAGTFDPNKPSIFYQADTVQAQVDADLVNYARQFLEMAKADGLDAESAWDEFSQMFADGYEGQRDAFEEAAREVFAPDVVIPKVARSKRRTKLDDLRGLGREDDGSPEFADPNAGKPTRREMRQRETEAAGAFGADTSPDGMIEDDGTVEYAEPVAPPTAEERTAQSAANKAARTAREDTASGAFGQDIEDEVKRDLAKMLMGLDKSGPVETVLALRKAGLLTGVKTALRNIGGNTAFQALEEVARIPSSLVDMALALYSGQRTVAGMSPVAFAKATREAATKGIADAAAIMRGEKAVDAFLKTGERRELNSGYKWLDAYANTVFRFLSAQDAVFKSYAFRRSMEEQATLMAKERGVTPAELLLQPTEAMIVRATADAEFATFNNPNMVAKAWNSGVSTLKRNGPGGQAVAAVAEFVVPFTNTPSNIIARLFDYMGVTAAGTVPAHAWQAYVKDGLTPEHQRVIAQALGRGFTGSALVYAGYMLAAAGKMTGGGEDEDKGDRNLATAAGRLPGAILIGDRWHSISAFSPVGMLLTVGASLHRRHTKPEANKSGIVAEGFRTGAQIMLDQPMLSGMQDTLNFFRRDGQERYIASQAGSFIPTIVSDAASLFDPYRRETRTDGFLPSLWAGVQARLPGARNYLPQRVDVLGRTQDQIASNAVNPLLSTPAKELSDPVVKALLDADVGVTFPVRKQGEDEDAYRVRVEKTGQEIERFVKATVSAPGFAKLPVERRTKLLKAAIDRAKDRVPAPKATP